MAKTETPHYVIEPYDGDGIVTCEHCRRNFYYFDMRDVFRVLAYNRKNMRFLGAYCKNCAMKMFPAVAKPVNDSLTYSDIISSIQYMIEESDDEDNELTALTNLINDLYDLIKRLQSESPSQTPSQP